MEVVEFSKCVDLAQFTKKGTKRKKVATPKVEAKVEAKKEVQEQQQETAKVVKFSEVKKKQLKKKPILHLRLT